MRRFIYTIILFSSFSVNGISQNVYEIVCAAYNSGRSMRNVNYKLINDDKTVAEVVSKNGQFQFAIEKGDASYVLEISKENFITKKVHFNPSTYPFENEYEIQEIDLEFVSGDPKNFDPQVGELKWSSAGDIFGVVRIEQEKEVRTIEEEGENPLNAVYNQAIVNADELYEMAQYSFARKDYELALIARPEDEYATAQLAAINLKLEEKSKAEEGITAEVLDKINKGELTEVKGVVTENILYSVQLGAFSGVINEEKFKNVPEFKTVQYEDYARCFSGEFTDVNAAILRKKDMASLGFKDAWIVKMKGNQRIGF